jgi:hypothetical protein
MSMKNFNDTIWNRTRDLPACSAVPQATAPPRTGLDVTQDMGRWRAFVSAVMNLRVPENALNFLTSQEGLCSTESVSYSLSTFHKFFFSVLLFLFPSFS